MDDFTDGTNRTIIIVVFFIFYMYLKYTQTQLKMSKNIGTVSCNPLDMMIGGLFNEEEANKTFSQCMEYSSAEQTQKSQDELSSQYDSDIAELITDIRTNMSEQGNADKEQQKRLFDLLNKKTSKVKELVKQQQMINSTFEQTDTPVDSVIGRFETVASQFKSVTEEIKP